MAGLKKLSTRIVNKHATAAVWNNTNFTPLQGEIVVYDPGYDSKDGKTYTRERMKIGDGSRSIQDLPFVNELNVKTNKTTGTTTVVTHVGDAQYTPAQATLASMGQTLTDETLCITFDAGSYTPATYVAAETTTAVVSKKERIPAPQSHQF